MSRVECDGAGDAARSAARASSAVAASTRSGIPARTPMRREDREGYELSMRRLREILPTARSAIYETGTGRKRLHAPDPPVARPARKTNTSRPGNCHAMGKSTTSALRGPLRHELPPGGSAAPGPADLTVKYD